MIARVEQGDSDYEDRRRGIVWNELVPDRFPAAIVRPSVGAEVAEIVRAARREGHRVNVRSGGHNWLGSSLRDDAVVLDLGGLNAIEVDVEKQRATVEPGATHKVLADAIVPHGLGFPIGHCPTVGLGGYLLAGGSGWNGHEWGLGCWNVVGADVVLADGSEVHVSENGEPELFWALRGGSAGFPGIVIRFHVQLKELPAICTRRVAFPVARTETLLPWAADRLGELDPGIEISLIARVPFDDPSAAPRVTVAVTGFGADDAAARGRVEEALAGVPDKDAAIYDSGPEPIQLNDLEGEGGWHEGLRYFVDNCWTSGRYAETGRLVAQAIEASPSPQTRVVLAFHHTPGPGPDVAFTRFGDLTVNFYATWPDASADTANIAWVREWTAPFEDFRDGYYIGETDLSASPDRVREAYLPAKWDRLQQVIETFDPDRCFHGFVGQD